MPKDSWRDVTVMEADCYDCIIRVTCAGSGWDAPSPHPATARTILATSLGARGMADGTTSSSLGGRIGAARNP